MGVKIVDTALRDGSQSLIATRLTTDEILQVAPIMDKAGYYAMEVWGGATFDSCLRFLDEDPWERLRAIRKACPNTRLQMLFRGQNILGYHHYADDVVEKFVFKSYENGINVIRVFDALNDIRNLRSAVEACHKYKQLHPDADAELQIALSYTTSPVHTIAYYVKLAKDVEALGADSLCIKDMAGVLLPMDAYNLIKGLKAETKLPIELHSHCTGGICQLTYEKAIEAGVDIIDTALAPLSGGTSQPCTESFNYALRGTEYDPKLDQEKLNEASSKLSKIMNKYIKNGTLKMKALMVNPNILKYQVPGGMLSNLMNQLEKQGALDKLDEVCAEVPNVRKDLGYPPLVTPMSQMVGTQAVMNVMTGERYKMCPKEIKDYLLGKYGAAPAPINEEVRKKVLGENHEEIITCRPADLLKPEFEDLKKKYRKVAKCDEDVLSIALFEQVAVKFLEKKYGLVAEEYNVTL